MSQDVGGRPLLARAFTLAAKDFSSLSSQGKLYKKGQTVEVGVSIFKENSFTKEEQESPFFPQGLCEKIGRKRLFLR